MELPTLYHLAEVADWDPDATEPYAVSTRGASLADVGFIHLSLARQVQATAARFFGDSDVVLLRLDPRRLGARVEFEFAPEAGDRFPHLYGPIPRGAITAANPVPRTGAGGHVFAGLLPEPI